MRTASHWEKVGLFAHHGICVPLFSLRSKKSCGIGEFNDLLPLIDWCKKRGFDCLQLLPLNDTGDDSSPYNPVSSCALDPIYLSLADLSNIEELFAELATFTALNQSDRLQRKEVKEQKTKWLCHYFSKVFTSLSHSSHYKDFLSQNPWLLPYARFKVLSQEYKDQPWTHWPNPLIEIAQEALDFHFFLQYLCFSQLENIRAYASSQNVFLKGDIPILLNPNSADVWAERSLFRLDLTAGAPPDYYTPLGQNWGFPLFNWEEMRKTHFTWWKRRLAVATRLYHLYRIDHVVGFFRIWAIPLGEDPKQGSFIPSERSTWIQQGEEILQMMIDTCPLLPIAEDLGTIPDEVSPSLKNLGICGTKVVRWQKNKDHNYIPYDQYEPFSMTTVSTWDCDTVRMWWDNFPDEAAKFSTFKHWKYHSKLSSKALLSLLQDAHHTPSYFHINLLQEYLSLFPELIWDGGEKERLNIPGTLFPSNWTYRFRPFLKEMLNHKGLQEAIETILHPKCR